MGFGAIASTAVAASKLGKKADLASRNAKGSGTSHDPTTMRFKAIGDAEGAEALVAAMDSDPRQVTVQIACLSVVAHMGWGSGMCKRSVLQARGAQAVLGAMAAHKDQMAVQETGLLALANLACDDDAFSRAMGPEGGLLAVTAAMKAHQAQHAMQMHGLRILCAVACFGSPECLQALVQAKGDACLVATMRALPGQAAVQEAGCCALGALARSSALGMKAVVAAKGAEAAVAALRAHGTQTHVVLEGCVALESLAASPQAQLVERGVYPV